MTDEFVELIQAIRKEQANIGILWDSSHVALNKEDFIESLEKCHEYVYGIHLANAVLEPEHELFGDHHMPMGAPGFLTEEYIASFLKDVKAKAWFENRSIYLAVEVASTETQDPWDTHAQSQKCLMSALENL